MIVLRERAVRDDGDAEGRMEGDLPPSKKSKRQRRTAPRGDYKGKREENNAKESE